MKFTDVKLAERFAPRAADRLRYCDELGTWVVWRKGRWQPDRTRYRERVAKALVLSLEDEIAAIVDDEERKRAWGKYSGRLSLRGLTNLLGTLASEPRIATTAADWDADPLRLMTPGGLVDLTTGHMRPATQADLFMQSTSVTPDRRVRVDRWVQFIDEITQGNDELAEYLRRAIGMTLVGEQRDQVLLLCSGIGSNGKSLLIETLCDLLGDYACLAMPNLLSARTHEAHTTELMQLRGRRLVYCDEVKGNRLDESKIKRMTGGRNITARKMHGDPQTFPVEFTIWADCNANPTITGTDDGIWRRIQLVPFRAQFMGDTRDPLLDRKLAAEAPGILAWAIDAASDYLREGMAPSADVERETKAYRSDQDALAEFVELALDVNPDHAVSSSTIYDAACAYFASIGWKAPGKPRFTSQLKQRGIADTCRGAKGARLLRGVRLKEGWREALGLPTPPDYPEHYASH